MEAEENHVRGDEKGENASREESVTTCEESHGLIPPEEPLRSLR